MPSIPTGSRIDYKIRIRLESNHYAFLFCLKRARTIRFVPVLIFHDLDRTNISLPGADENGKMAIVQFRVISIHFDLYRSAESNMSMTLICVGKVAE